MLRRASLVNQLVARLKSGGKIDRNTLLSRPALLAAGFLLTLLAAPDAARANQEQVYYSFAGGADGSHPYSRLVKYNGSHYGTTSEGGSSGCGTVYKITKGQESVLHAFQSGSDGCSPVAPVVFDSQGNLYGTTYYGGGSSNCSLGCGTVYKITPDGSETVLHAFTGGVDGEAPGTLIADAEDNLYGTTLAGGSGAGCTNGCGTVFKITPEGVKTTVYSFNPSDGDGTLPNSLVLDGQGNLYGATYGGGSGSGDCGVDGCGTLFKLTPDGQETVLFNFNQSQGVNPAPGSLLMNIDGNFYGSVFHGGRYSYGTIFKATPDGVVTVLHDFPGGSGGGYPGSLVAGPSGNLYCVASFGANLTGLIFNLTLAGVGTVLYEFGPVGSGDADDPRAISVENGGIIGTSYSGGANDVGAIFRIKR